MARLARKGLPVERALNRLPVSGLAAEMLAVAVALVPAAVVAAECMRGYGNEQNQDAGDGAEGMAHVVSGHLKHQRPLHGDHQLHFVEALPEAVAVAVAVAVDVAAAATEDVVSESAEVVLAGLQPDRKRSVSSSCLDVVGLGYHPWLHRSPEELLEESAFVPAD